MAVRRPADGFGRGLVAVAEAAVVAVVYLVVEVCLALTDPRVPRPFRLSLAGLAARLGLRLDLEPEDARPVPSAPLSPLSPPDLPAWARRRLLAVDRVTRRWPAGDTCLRRCLVEGQRLAPLRPALRVGALAAPDGALTGHAWLEFGGRPLGSPAAGFVRHGEV